MIQIHLRQPRALLPLAYLSLVAFATWLAAKGNSWPTRHVAALSVIAAATYVMLSWRRWERILAEAWDAINLISGLDHHDLTGSNAAAPLRRLPEDHPWRAVFERLIDNLAQHAHKAETAEQARRQTEHRIRCLSDQVRGARGLLNAAGRGILLLDARKNVLLANEAAAHLLNLSQPKFPCALEHLLETLPERPLCRPTTDGFRWSFENRDGGEKRVLRVQRLAWPALGERQGQLLILEDQSQGEPGQGKWRELARDIQEQSDRPLRTLQALDELITDALCEDGSDREDYLQALHRNAARLEQLGDHLRDLCRIEKESRDTVPQRFEWPALVEEAARKARDSYEGRSVRITVRHDPPAALVAGHRDVLLNALLQLVLNCMKSASVGGALSLTTTSLGDSAVLELHLESATSQPADAGEAAVAMARQANAWLRQGDGVGLPLAKHIICELHGGSLTVDRSRESGPRFRVTLPSRSEAGSEG